MACERADTVVHGYFDNELDALRAAEFESHLEQCPECVAALDALESLRSTINVAQPYEKMSASFRKKILADLHVKAPDGDGPGACHNRLAMAGRSPPHFCC